MARDAQSFDAWYANMQVSARHGAIVSAALGLPPGLDSSSLLPWDGIAEVADTIGVGAGDTLVDLGCGRGGYGIEIAARTGAALVGVDFSAVAIAQASAHAPQARFVVGELTATGLPDASADAVVSIDAMQFAEPYGAGLAECLRVLVPGGRLALTGWEPLGDDDALPERLRRDIGAELRAAGAVDIEVREMADWRRAERALWQGAVATDPDGDLALESLRSEGASVLQWLDASRRVLAVARRPAGG